ncbi:class I adenylate-forming enzyme family protein [Halostagnicola bangensis]
MVKPSYLDSFRSIVRRYPNATAVSTLNGREVTYEELDDRTDALATALNERLGDSRCAVLAENRIASIESMIAAMKRGQANTQLFTRNSIGDLMTMVETSQTQGLIFDTQSAGKALELIDRLDITSTIHIRTDSTRIQDAEPYEEVLSETDSGTFSTTTDDSKESAVFFTSGTTGNPKGVLVDQEQSWLAAHQPALEMSLTAHDRALVCTPWYHQVTANTWILAHLLVGATLIIQPTFEPKDTLQAIETHNITGLLAVPTQLRTLREVQKDVQSDLGTLSYIRTGGAIVPKQLIQSIRDEFTENVFNTYGQTEGMVNLTFAYPEEQLDHPGTVGKSSFFWELRVTEIPDSSTEFDPENTVAPGEIGEIIGKSPGMTDGYLGEPKQQDETFVDGWLRTGDVARVDEDGYLVITDRVDNMINSGGENIYPKEVERALLDHAKVSEVGIVGMPDEKWGQIVSAAVVASDDITEADLGRHCQEHDTLPNFKRPRQYVLLPEETSLPRSSSGTLQREKIKELFCQ